jgi:hypothetical protein
MSSISNLAIGIAGSVVAAAVVAVVVALWRKYRSGFGAFAGEWDQLIPAYRDEPEKKDIVQCRHRGATVHGIIRRVAPAEQNWKVWRFVGRVRENVVAMCFWSEDQIQDSFGTILLVHSGEHKYQGHYTKLRPAERRIDRVVDERASIPFTWHKRSHH